MQLPDHLLRTYRKYKEQEAVVIDWICTTAEGYGFAIKKRKLKGKEKVKARKAALSATSGRTDTHSSSDWHHEQQIAILDILAPVQAIVDSDKFKFVPEDICLKLFEVLQLRKQCAAWYKSNTAQHDAATRADNEKHQYPIFILQQAIRLLKIKFSNKQHKVEKTSAESSSSKKDLRSNQPDYSVLGSDTDSDPFVSCSSDTDTSCSSLSDPASTAKARTTPETIALRSSKEERTEDEYDLAQYCLYRDLEEMEDFMVLEFVRYSLDQQNSDFLPYLMTVAIDRALQMIFAIRKFVEDNSGDHLKFQERWLRKMHRENYQTLVTTPLLRMQQAIGNMIAHNHIAKEQRQKAKSTGTIIVEGGPLYQFSDSVVTPDYFNATPEDQMDMDQSYVHTLFLDQRPKEQLALNADMTSSLIDHLLADDFAGTGGKQVWLDVHVAFAVRMRLLLRLILGEKAMIAYESLQKHATQRARLQLQLKLYVDGDLYHDAVDPKLQRTFIDSAALKPREHLQLHDEVNGRCQQYLMLNHISCCMTMSRWRMVYASNLISAIDTTCITKVLAHLWEVLRHKGLLSREWQDLDYLQGKLGRKFFFQTDAEDAITDLAIIRRRIFYAMGMKWKTVEPFLYGGMPPHFWKFRGHQHLCYIASDRPTFILLDFRNQHDMFKSDKGTIDLELVANATLVRPIIGKPPEEVRFSDLNSSAIANRAELWKLLDEGPTLSHAQLLSTIKEGLRQDMRVVDFGYVEMLEATAQLVNTLFAAFGGLPGSRFAGMSEGTPWEKLRKLMFDVFLDFHPAKLTRIAGVFDEWLKKYDNIGSRQLPPKCPEPTYPLPLRPDVIKIVEGIVQRRGLLDKVFTKAQVWGLGQSVQVTESLEDSVRRTWAEQRKNTRGI